MLENIEPDQYAGRKVLVTGGSGFIGSHLVRRLVIYGAEVVVVDDFSTGPRSYIKEVEEDIRLIESDLAKMSRPLPGFSEVDRIFHLASVPSVARSLDDPMITHRANLTGTLRLLEIAKRIEPETVVMTGSTVTGAAVTAEDRRDGGDTCGSVYAASKGAMELYMEPYVHNFELPCLLLRLSHVFGPRQHQDDGYASTLSSLILQVIHGERPELAREEQEGHDYIFVEDVVKALLLAGLEDERAGTVCDVCTGQFRSDRELLETLDELSSSPIGDPKYVEREDPYTERAYPDPEGAREMLGFEPEASFEQALARTFDWFKDHTT